MIKKRVLRAAARTAAIGAMAAGAVAGATATASAEQVDPAGTVPEGCPSGAVCLYNPEGFRTGHPEHVYWAYGAHGLTDEYGPHHIYNNQHSGATVQLCTGVGGTGCGPKLPPGHHDVVDLTPINALKLAA